MKCDALAEGWGVFTNFPSNLELNLSIAGHQFYIIKPFFGKFDRLTKIILLWGTNLELLFFGQGERLLIDFNAFESLNRPVRKYDMHSNLNSASS